MSASAPHPSSSTPQGQRIAVIGAGIAGLASAYLLARQHRVTLYEAASRLGGHTHTVDVTLDGHQAPVDIGFQVFNERTYPNLLGLFAELGVDRVPTRMTFSLSLDDGALEWAGTSLDTVFAQRSKLFSPRFLGMLRDILRFNREAPTLLAQAVASGTTLGRLLDATGYGTAMCEDYLLPMSAAIWSSPPKAILDFPAETFLNFCLNHALLQINGRPTWFTVARGARSYVERIAAALPDIRLGCPVQSLRRLPDGVVIRSAEGVETFDAVVLASHAPDSLAMLDDPDAQELAVLQAVRYQPNQAVLHTDTALLPRRRKVWSAWNYLGGRDIEGGRPVCVSYLVNHLQPLPFRTPLVVTLNPLRAPAPGTLLGGYSFAHPLFSSEAIAAQQRLPEIQGKRRTWYAGAWTRYGFHEDGLRSALQVAAAFGPLPAWASL